MSSKSKSSTTNLTETHTNNMQTESGIQVAESEGVSIIQTDHDSVELSFDAINNTVDEAFNFGHDSVDRAFDFGEDALNEVSQTTERAIQVNQQALGTVKDFAENLKVGDLKITKTVILTGAIITTTIIFAAFVMNGNKKKASKK